MFARYGRWLLGGTALLMLLTAAFNRVVDPFQYFGDLRIQGFNAIKSRLRFFEREVKPAVLRRDRPESVIIGSSVAAIGFEPLHPESESRRARQELQLRVRGRTLEGGVLRARVRARAYGREAHRVRHARPVDAGRGLLADVRGDERKSGRRRC